MLGAVQPFLSGGASKTINLPNDATVEDIEKIYLEAWKLGIKSVALYRDGCKASQPFETGKGRAPGARGGRAGRPGSVSRTSGRPSRITSPSAATTGTSPSGSIRTDGPANCSSGSRRKGRR